MTAWRCVWGTRIRNRQRHENIPPCEDAKRNCPRMHLGLLSTDLELKCVISALHTEQSTVLTLRFRNAGLGQRRQMELGVKDNRLLNSRSCPRPSVSQPHISALLQPQPFAEGPPEPRLTSPSLFPTLVPHLNTVLPTLGPSSCGTPPRSLPSPGMASHLAHGKLPAHSSCTQLSLFSFSTTARCSNTGPDAALHGDFISLQSSSIAWVLLPSILSRINFLVQDFMVLYPPRICHNGHLTPTSDILAYYMSIPLKIINSV